MKYRLKIYCRTELTKKVSGYMREILDEWRETGKELEICQVSEIETSEPLTQEAIERLQAIKNDFIRAIEVEAVTAPAETPNSV